MRGSDAYPLHNDETCAVSTPYASFRAVEVHNRTVTGSVRSVAMHMLHIGMVGLAAITFGVVEEALPIRRGGALPGAE